MVDGLVIAGIVILCVMAAAELVYIFFIPAKEGEETEPKVFTVLLYRQDDENFAGYLREFLSRARWMDGESLSRIYVVHENIPEEQSESVRRICEREQGLVYCRPATFAERLFPEKNSAEKDCNLTEKRV
ncbi:MAG: hypothetical protein IJ496_01955 [Ruminococcus sp.]|nr:hypothetical protein [Ruminococcus sp.]